jgi:hypothetical protein
MRIATIDTMLSFYLAFLYIDNPLYNYNPDRILCMAHFLFEVQQRNRLTQKGLLKRFSINCIGHQETIEEMRAKKAEKYSELKANRKSKEFEEWFLRYRPSDIVSSTQPEEASTNEKVDKKQEPKRATRKKRASKKPSSGLLGIFKRS